MDIDEAFAQGSEATETEPTTNGPLGTFAREIVLEVLEEREQ